MKSQWFCISLCCCCGKCVVLLYYYLNIQYINVFLCPSIESDWSKFDSIVLVWMFCSLSLCHYPLMKNLISTRVKFQSWNCPNWQMWKIGFVHACWAPKVISNCRNALSLMKELEAELRLVCWGCWYIVIYWMAIIKSSGNDECVIICHKRICWKLSRYI